MEEEKKQSPEGYRAQIDELQERVKELNCFYGISSIVKDTEAPLEDALCEIVELMPPAWHHHDIAEARIIFNGFKCESEGFEETPWMQHSDIIVDGEKVGELQVAYLEERPEMDEGPFLKDERRLINAISELLGTYLSERHVRSTHSKGEVKKSETSVGKENWEVIIDLLLKTDPRMLLRITRKMVYHLYRKGNKSIEDVMQTVCPVTPEPGTPQWCGINMPNPRKNLDSLKTVQEEVFRIAKDSLPPGEISDLFQRWLREDKARPLLLSSQRKGIPFVEITDEVNRFYENYGGEKALAPEDSMTIRTALLSRFFTDRLEFINVAKKYISLDHFVPLLKNVIGCAQGAGKLGGKTSGVILAHKIIEKELEGEDIVSFPRSWYMTSDTMMDLIQYNDLDEVVHVKYLEPEEIRQEYPILEQIFKNAVFTSEIVEGLRRILRDIKDRPLIIRSSSLLEDSFGAAFSGKYKSLFIANTGSEDERLSALTNAIAEVYASTLAPDPIEYRKERGLLDMNEQMGVLIQEVVGTRIGPYFIPAYAGVAFSQNEFRWSPRVRREDGIVRIVTGLGTRAVDRVSNDYPILVSPKRPELRVNAIVEEQVKYSQKYMDVINMETDVLETVNATDLLKEYSDEYPELENIVSVYEAGRLSQPSVITDMKNSDVVITFEGLFRNGKFLRDMDKVLTLLEDTLDTPVDVEFASDGKKLYVLQCRPQSQSQLIERKPIPEGVPLDKKVFTAHRYVTTGCIENVEYIVYVDPSGYEELESREEMYKVARIVSELNSLLPKRRFILMGPGRWGSRGDIKLGVPIQYRDINNTSLLVEIAREKGGYLPELSFGTHFFQDLVESNIKYLPLYPDEEENVFNERLLKHSPNVLTELLPSGKGMENFIRVIHIPDTYPSSKLAVVMDGDANEALAYIKPPDHWEWRMDKVRELARNLDADFYDVKAMYVMGSTKDGTAGPSSDIDLLIHFEGNERQREMLLEWFKQQEKKYIEENEERTGRSCSKLLDVHIITEKDIENKTSWASHIDSPYSSAREIPLNR